MATELKRATTPLDRIEELLGENARTLLDHTSKTIPRTNLICPVRTLSIASGHTRTVRLLSCAHCNPSSTMAGWQGPDTFRFCRWIRASNTPPVPRLHPTRSTSIPITS